MNADTGIRAVKPAINSSPFHSASEEPAMDTRRFNNRPRDDINFSSSTLPGVVILLLGCCVIVLGIILIAALGIPKSSFGKEYSGPICIGIGVIITSSGVIASCYLKNREKTAQRNPRRVSPTPCQPQDGASDEQADAYSVGCQ